MKKGHLFFDYSVRRFDIAFDKESSTITNTILMAASIAAKHCRFSPQNTAGHLLVLSMILAMTILPRTSMVTGGGISSEWKA